MRRPSITVQQAQRIVTKHLSDPGIDVVQLTELVSAGYSYTPTLTTYIVDLQGAPPFASAPVPAPCTCWLTIAPPNPEQGAYHTNHLPVVYDLLQRVIAKSELPFRNPILDTTLTDVPYHYIVFPIEELTSSDFITLAEARREGRLSERDNVRLDLQIGKILAELHTGVQNDWFGMPGLEEGECCSWQEAFTALLEGLLSFFQVEGLELPYGEIRRCLSRAIGSFLFDDVDVPSFVWFTGSEHDVYVVPHRGAAKIAAVFPSLSHALWGDPLLESVFIDASEATWEAYWANGGGKLVLFPRQRTKKVWYTLFLALVVLKEHGVHAREDDEYPASPGRRRWCVETIGRCVEVLKDAPCY